MGELEGKFAVITGAGSGMAKACSQIFVREGAKVLGADISGREKQTADELGGAFVPFHADVSSEADVEAMIAAALDSFGRIDAVLNVAGFGTLQPLIDIKLEDYEKTMGVDLRGVVLGTKHAIKAMLPTGGGVILNWSSVGGLNASRHGLSTYSAAKAGVIAFTKAAAVEYGGQGIRAVAICPGGVVTERFRSGEASDRYRETIPLKRSGDPEEIAELACFLASDRAGFITGVAIPIDGGQSAVLV